LVLHQPRANHNEQRFYADNHRLMERYMMDLKSGMLAALTAGFLMVTTAGHAAQVEIKLLDKGSGGGMMVFEPAFVKIAPGDSVHFMAVDKDHNVASILGMIPAGAEAFAGKMGRDLTVTFTEPGVYGVKCTPHYAMGMVALIAVGDPQANLDAAKAVPQSGKAKTVFATLFSDIGK
jgi:pseudoazurin